MRAIRARGIAGLVDCRRFDGETLPDPEDTWRLPRDFATYHGAILCRSRRLAPPGAS